MGIRGSEFEKFADEDSDEFCRWAFFPILQMRKFCRWDFLEILQMTFFAKSTALH